jgi:hypothetical protein
MFTKRSVAAEPPAVHELLAHKDCSLADMNVGLVRSHHQGVVEGVLWHCVIVDPTLLL